MSSDNIIYCLFRPGNDYYTDARIDGVYDSMTKLFDDCLTEYSADNQFNMFMVKRYRVNKNLVDQKIYLINNDIIFLDPQHIPVLVQ
jgi:hypothetical protein